MTEATQQAQAVLVVQDLPGNAGDIGDAVRSPAWEDSLEEEVATHSSILAWEIPLTEEPGGLQSMGVTRVGHGTWLSD